MNEVINKILKQEKINIRKIEKIKSGFTNQVYIINNKYILKICTNQKNESNFIKEIEFYLSNNENKSIPKLYSYNTKKEDIPYLYEILEKINGKPLYSIWHMLTTEEREQTIKELCNILKNFHKNKKEKYNWNNYISKQFDNYYNKKLFTKNEQLLIEKAHNKFSKYLNIDVPFVLTHNDIHFDNIIKTNTGLRIIDFERSMVAPIDFELDILTRMIRNPLKFANEDDENNIDIKHYKMIPVYLEKYYKEITSIPYLTQRLAIYDIIYYLRQYKNIENVELKNPILEASKIIILKDELLLENIKDETELMDWMDINIKYGWLDKNKNKYIGTLENFKQKYQVAKIEDTIKYGTGTCIEQTKLEKQVLNKLGYTTKIYCRKTLNTNESQDKIELHFLLIYEKNNSWYYFEHAEEENKGIKKYSTIENAINTITQNNNQIKMIEIDYIPEGLTFEEIKEHIKKYENAN